MQPGEFQQKNIQKHLITVKTVIMVEKGGVLNLGKSVTNQDTIVGPFIFFYHEGLN